MSFPTNESFIQEGTYGSTVQWPVTVAGIYNVFLSSTFPPGAGYPAGTGLAGAIIYNNGIINLTYYPTTTPAQTHVELQIQVKASPGDYFAFIVGVSSAPRNSIKTTFTVSQIA